EELPACERGSQRRVSNSDPITGQAAWYDVRVRIYKADEEVARGTARAGKVGAGGTARTEPQFAPLQPYPGMPARKSIWNYFAGKNR
ncbi:MAG: hypothetical protein ACK4N6_04530, partial [Rhodocyclaceae bacterium]